MTQPIKKILVYVYEDLLGDALLKRPFVHALRGQFPDAHITWCAGGGRSSFKRAFAPLVEGVLNVVVEQPLGRHVGEIFQPSAFKDQSFDLIIDTQRDLWPTLMLKRIRHKAFLSRTMGFLWSDFKPKIALNWGGHLSERLLQLLSVYKGESVVPTLGPSLNLMDYMVGIKGMFAPHKTYVGLAPGAGGQKKCWPLACFLKIAKYCVVEGAIPVFILGPAETEWETTLRAQCPEALFPLQDCPDLLKDPLNTAAIAHHLRVCLANDAGVGHLLGLSPTHLISLFGPTDAKKVRPLAANSTVLRAQSFGGEAMDFIPPDAVINEIKKFIKKS